MRQPHRRARPEADAEREGVHGFSGTAVYADHEVVVRRVPEIAWVKESGETLQMRASKGAITCGVQGDIGTGTRMLAVILPQTLEQVIGEVMVILNERIQECIAEEVIEVMEFGRVTWCRIAEWSKIVDGPVPQVREQIG